MMEAVDQAMEQLPPPTTIAGKSLRFEKKIGEGGFAIVYLCKDDYDRPFAVKKCFVQTKEQMDAMTSELTLLQVK